MAGVGTYSDPGGIYGDCFISRKVGRMRGSRPGMVPPGSEYRPRPRSPQAVKQADNRGTTVGASLRRLLAEPGRLIKVFAVGQLCNPKIVEMIGLYRQGALKDEDRFHSLKWMQGHVLQ